MKTASLILSFLCFFSMVSVHTATAQTATAADTTATDTTATDPSKPVKAKNRNMGVEISAGYAMVMGDYSAVDKENDKAGYATNGWQLQLTFDWMGKKDLGMAIQYTYQQNPLDDSTASLVPNGWSTGTLGPGSWSNHYLMLGPVYMKKIKRLHLDGKLLIGAIVSSSDNFTTQNPYDSTGIKKDVNLGVGFAYGISVGIGIAVTSQLALKLNFGLLGGWPAKNRSYPSQYLGSEQLYDPKTGLTYYVPVYSAPVEYEIKKVVTTFNPSFGLVYRF